MYRAEWCAGAMPQCLPHQDQRDWHAKDVLHLSGWNDGRWRRRRGRRWIGTRFGGRQYLQLGFPGDRGSFPACHCGWLRHLRHHIQYDGDTSRVFNVFWRFRLRGRVLGGHRLSRERVLLRFHILK